MVARGKARRCLALLERERGCRDHGQSGCALRRTNGRAASPKYLLGESYGGFRAAKVASALQEDQGIVVSGIVMLSPMLEGAFQFGGDRFALGAALDLPSLAAAEMERRNNFDARTNCATVEHFALTDYLTTLAGPPPQGDAARTSIKHVAQITGIDEDAVARSHGFLRDSRQKNLRRPADWSRANTMRVS